MKVMLSVVAVAVAMLVPLATAADAAQNARAQLEASCKNQAAKKYSILYFMKRRSYVKSCMDRRA
jgi:hypothetical protein